MTTMNRRSFVKSAAAVAAGTMLASTTALADAASEGIVPGTYIATAPGYMGENTVMVTVDEASIVDVAVVRSTDVPEIARFQALSFHDVNGELISSLMNVAGDTVLKM